MANKGGAKPTLTPEIAKSICDDVAKCVPLAFAAGNVGVPERTLMGWLAKGRKGHGEPYSQFWHDIQKARHKAVSVRVSRIRKAGRDTWPANAWLLERMHPEEFGTDKRLVATLLEQMTVLRAELEAARADAGGDRKRVRKAKAKRRKAPEAKDGSHI